MIQMHLRLGAHVILVCYKVVSVKYLTVVSVGAGLLAVCAPAYADLAEEHLGNRTKPVLNNPANQGLINSLKPAKAGKKAAAQAGNLAKRGNAAAAKKSKAKARRNPARQVRKKGPISITPVQAKKTQRNTRQVKRNRPRGKTAKWWDKTGNPAVFKFRDCAVNYAMANTRLEPPSSAADLISAAMKADCQRDFSVMAGVLIGGLGEQEANRVMRELAATTILPAVQKAVTFSTFRLQAKRVSVNRKSQLKQAKRDMFRCFTVKADRLSIARNISPDTIADAVIAGCRQTADKFFDILFANNRDNAVTLAAKKETALNETYRQAIVKRVVVMRRSPSKIKTAKSKDGVFGQ